MPSKGPQAAIGGQSAAAKGPSTAARTDLESCRLGNCTFGKLQLGKIPLGSCNLGKYPWEVATWEKSFWKIPNIHRSIYLFTTVPFKPISRINNIFIFIFQLWFVCEMLIYVAEGMMEIVGINFKERKTTKSSSLLIT